MSTSYYATVFYGAFVPSKSKAGRILGEALDKYGGSPAPLDGQPGVEISQVGSYPTGDLWTVIAAKGSMMKFDRDADIVAPAHLAEKRMWHHDVAAVVGLLDISVDAIGWHFGGTAI